MSGEKRRNREREGRAGRKGAVLRARGEGAMDREEGAWGRRRAGARAGGLLVLRWLVVTGESGERCWLDGSREEATWWRPRGILDWGLGHLERGGGRALVG